MPLPDIQEIFPSSYQRQDGLYVITLPVSPLWGEGSLTCFLKYDEEAGIITLSDASRIYGRFSHLRKDGQELKDLFDEQSVAFIEEYADRNNIDIIWYPVTLATSIVRPAEELDEAIAVYTAWCAFLEAIAAPNIWRLYNH